MKQGIGTALDLADQNLKREKLGEPTQTRGENCHKENPEVGLWRGFDARPDWLLYHRLLAVLRSGTLELDVNRCA